MEPRGLRDLDHVIDDVARTMTSTEPGRDLRTAVASRIVAPSRWVVGWRAGLAAATMAAVVLAAVVLQPRPATPPSRTAETIHASAAAVAPLDAARAEAPAKPDVKPAARGIRRVRAAVGRQVVADDAAVQSTVEIAPLTIVPLGEERAAAPAQARIEIAPIDVEPVRVRELDERVE